MSKREPPKPKQSKPPPMPRDSSFSTGGISAQEKYVPEGVGNIYQPASGAQAPLNPGQENFMQNLTDEQLIQLVQKDPKLKEAYEKIVKEQAAKLNTNKPITSAEYLKIQKLEPYLDSEGGITIEPSTNFVFKTFEDGSNEKFFINIVTHPAIDEPEQKYLVDYENQPGLRIPMSLGKVKEDHDKKGDLCKVVDAVMNPNTIQTVHKEEGLKAFLMEILATYIQEKYKIKLKPNFSTPKLKYKGKSIEFQRVKGKKAPKIQQLSEEEERAEEQMQRTGKRLIEDITGQNDRMSFVEEVFIPRPEWNLFLYQEGNDKEEPYDGNFDIRRVKKCHFEIKLPLLITGTKIALTAKSGEFQLQAGKFYELLLKFPFKVDPLSVQAHFNTQTRILHLRANAKPLVIQDQISTQNDQNTLPDDDNKKNQQEQLLEKLRKNPIELSNSMLDDLV